MPTEEMFVLKVSSAATLERVIEALDGKVFEFLVKEAGADLLAQPSTEAENLKKELARNLVH